ncbi:SdpI family protein [Anaerococcus sp. AGMB00486]|uniref:SdpI family protein n=1 Tax=Anaerococcus faecalis TaxID=2742993 RepID=A0ABX2NBH9_9FIRM|nr:SdpI family protein [Anaerococcus faecalis]NVF11909.1 SdpI family protein [Anaerococcus faecalis]
MKENRKNLLLSFILFLISIILAIIYYDRLPVRIPVHYDFDWQVDIYAKKINALLFIVIFMVLVYLALYFILTLDPKRNEHDESYKHISLLTIPILNLLIIGLTIRKTFDPSLNVGRIIVAVIAVFIAISGVFMPKINRNYTLGIRTPWALENDYVWKKTQKLSGLLLFINGVFSLIILGFSVKIAFILLTSLFILTIIVSFIYSYLIYNNLANK